MNQSPIQRLCTGTKDDTLSTLDKSALIKEWLACYGLMIIGFILENTLLLEIRWELVGKIV